LFFHEKKVISVRRFYPWILLAAALVLIGWKLWENQQRRRKAAELSQAERASVPVRVAAVQEEWLSPQLEVSGILMAAREMPIISETMGRVVAVYKRRGDYVKERDLIAQVDSELLAAKRVVAEANLRKLLQDSTSLQALIDSQAVASGKMSDLLLGLAAARAEKRVLEKQIENTSIRAPMSGTLTLCALEPGGVVGQGIPVAHITNLDRLLLMVKVSEREVLNVRKGQAVEVRADVRPDQPLEGRVTNVAPRADSAFTYLVEIEVPNPPQAPLLAGMHAKARFLFQEKRQGLVVPRVAITGSLQDAKVYVLVGDTAVQERQVQLGQSLGERIEVRSGLNRGERVVVAGQSYLFEKVRVRIVE